MKNITVSVDDEVYRRARRMAAERDTSVSALVAEYLTRLGGEENAFERFLVQQDALLAAANGPRVATRLTRDQVHDRVLARMLR